MAEVSPSLETIHNEEVGAGKAVSKALIAKIAKLVTYVKKNSTDVIGKIEFSGLTEEQFAEEKGYDLLDSQGQPLPMSEKKWVLFDSQDISGSDYANKTNITSLPDGIGQGAFIGQLRSSETMLQYQIDSIKSHSHNYTFFNGYSKDGGDDGESYVSGGNRLVAGATTATFGINETRPRNIRANIFIKINY